MNSENPLLVDTGNGLTITYKGIHLYSSKNPQGSARRLANETRLLPRTLVFVPSIGLGYGILELLEKLPEGCHILCLEHDPALFGCARTNAPLGLPCDERLSIVRCDNLASVREIAGRLDPSNFRRVVTVPLCAGYRLYEDFYIKAAALLREEIKNYWQNKMTLIHMGRIYVKNIIANLSLVPGDRDFANLVLERPLLVVGAGPSLAKSLGLIKTIRKKAALVAVDTALPVLLASGIVPDYVFVLESQFINIKDFTLLGDRAIPVIADIASSPQVLRFCASRGSDIHLFSSRFHPLSLFERLESAGLAPTRLPPLGSVGVAAVFAALCMTRRPVFLAGLDFSYTFFKTHSRGAPSFREELAATFRLQGMGQREYLYLLERPRIRLKDKQGQAVESDLVLSSYAQNLAELCRREGRVYDLNPFGLESGAPFLKTAGEVEDIIGRDRTQETRTPSSPRRFTDPDAVKLFLLSEKKNLQDGISCLKNLIAEKKADEAQMENTQADALNRIDYVWFYLPMKNRFPAYKKSHMAQILVHASYFSQLIERALCRLER